MVHVSMEPVIAAVDLKKTYGSFTAVDSIEFSVFPGEVFGFLGPNGAGKTTTMKMIMCASPKTSGSLTVFGRDVDRNPREIKAMIGVVPQETNLDTEFTTHDNLLVYSRYFGIPKKMAEERILELLDFVQLAEKKDVNIEKLSGGMKRRLLLARALVNQPKLLILDEPTIGLDPQARHLIWEKLKLLSSQGNTIVLTTHYLEEAERLCDRLVIMDNGKILVEGKPADLVRENLGSGIVEAESSPDVIACLEGMGIVYEVTGDTVQVVTDNPRDVAARLLSGCNAKRVLARVSTLEDVFLKLTGRGLKE
ncbi:MAG TPA: ATP-binding cassette domain-containing protein [Methanoregulaceae archaeon]|nr:ATP-binding cassette domain-containing protein [Methanoregulaceae archaeon]